MAIAGLWELWHDPSDPDTEPLRSCAIVTTAANDLMSPIHDRMPVVLAPSDWDAWLDPKVAAEDAQALLVPAPSEWFEAWPVRTLVNRVTNDGPELLEPASAPDA
jgi:putative SOS response-associated peptidase YedK